MEEVPVGAYTIPLGKANVKQQGSDITLVGWGQQVAVLEKAVSLAQALHIASAYHVLLLPLQAKVALTLSAIHFALEACRKMC